MRKLVAKVVLWGLQTRTTPHRTQNEKGWRASSRVKSYAALIIPLIGKMDARKLAIVRYELNQLKNSLKKAEKQQLVNCILFILKKINYEIVGNDPDETCNHIVTDHALCAALRRHYRFDVKLLKDKILEKSEQDNWLAAKINGKIVTFFPKVVAL